MTKVFEFMRPFRLCSIAVFGLTCGASEGLLQLHVPIDELKEWGISMMCVKRMSIAAVMVILSSQVCVAQTEANTDPTAACGAEIAAQPQYGLLLRHLPLASMKDMTFDMLSDSAKPNKTERVQIHAWVGAHQDCFARGQDFRQNAYPPEIVAIVAGAENKLLGVVADLYASKLTYGEANQHLQAVVDDVKLQVAAISQRLGDERSARDNAAADQAANRQAAAERQLQQDIQANQDRAAQAQMVQQQADAARRQAALQYLQSHPPAPVPFTPIPYAPIAPLPPISSPVRTNCQTYGNTINCTSQ